MRCKLGAHPDVSPNLRVFCSKQRERKPGAAKAQLETDRRRVAALFASPLTAFEDEHVSSTGWRSGTDASAAATAGDGTDSAASSFDPLLLGYDGELRTVVRKAKGMDWDAPKRLGLVLGGLLLVWAAGGPVQLMTQAAHHSYALLSGVLSGTITVTSVASSVLSTPSSSPLPPASTATPAPGVKGVKGGSVQQAVEQAAQELDQRWAAYRARENASVWEFTWPSFNVGGGVQFLSGAWGAVVKAATLHGVGINTQAVHDTWQALRASKWEAQALVLVCSVFAVVQCSIAAAACFRDGRCWRCCLCRCREGEAEHHSPQGKPVSPGGMHHGLDSALFGAGELTRHRRNTGRLDALSPLLKESGILPPSASHSRSGSDAERHASGPSSETAVGLDDLDVVAAAARSGLDSQDHAFNSGSSTNNNTNGSRRTSAFRNTHRRTRTSALLGQWAAAAAGTGEDGSPSKLEDRQGKTAAARSTSKVLSGVFAALHMSRLAAARAPNSGSGSATPAEVPPLDTHKEHEEHVSHHTNDRSSSSASSHRSVSPPVAPVSHRRTATTASLLRNAWTSADMSPERKAAGSPRAPPALNMSASMPGAAPPAVPAGRHSHRRSSTIAGASAAFSAALSPELHSPQHAPLQAAAGTPLGEQGGTAAAAVEGDTGGASSAFSSGRGTRAGRGSTVAARQTEAVFDAFSPGVSPGAGETQQRADTHTAMAIRASANTTNSSDGVARGAHMHTDTPGALPTAATAESASTAASSDPHATDTGSHTAPPPPHRRPGGSRGSGSWAHVPGLPTGGSIVAPSDVGSSASTREARSSARAARRQRMAKQLAALAGDEQ